MFSITLVNIDSYQTSPVPELDVTFSEFRGSEVKKVPIIRAFGSTATGKKTCLHIHGVFPYMYVACTVRENTDSYAYQLAAAIDSALNTSFGSALSSSQHVYKIQRVSGIPFYGYHEKEHLFFKIYFYNPAIIKRTADLLQNGAVLNQTLQPYEAHIPYILQFMIDYNLYGMNLINLNSVKYRHPLQGCAREDSQSRSTMDLLDTQTYLPISVTRQSMCELEVDVHASEILNGQGVTKNMELNPGLAAIWDEEKARRAEAGLEDAKSQLLYPKTPSKIILPPTSSDLFQEGQLLKRLNAISQTNETITPNTTVPSYPVEVEDNENVLDASHILNHNESLVSEENLERTVSDNCQLLQLASSALLEPTRSLSNITDTSILDADDIQLVEMLADLAEENEMASNVDDDSVLGSQYSTFSEPVKNDPEEEEVEDLNITSLDLDLSSWESVYNQRSNQRDNTDNKQNTESADNSNVTEENDGDVTLVNFPQVDGVDDLYETLKYEKETTNSLSNKDNTAVQCLSKITKNSKHNSYVSVINTRKDYAMCISYRNLNLMDIVKCIVNNPSRCHLRRELYNFVNRYCFHIFLKSSKNLRGTSTKYPHTDTSVVIRDARYLKDNEKRIVHNRKTEEELYIVRRQVQPDHRDLDVYDIDDIETFETLEHNSYIADYEADKCNCERDSKSCVEKGVLLTSDYCLHHERCNFSVKFTLSNIDGATATDSSDAESEADVTIVEDIKQEKRVCAYKSGKKNVPQSIVQVTPKKRKFDLQDDDHVSPGKRKNAGVKTPKRRYNSPGKAPRSPQLSGNYSPLNITITSPKSGKSPVRQGERSPKKNQCIPDAPSTTPKHKIRPLRVSLLREKFLNSDLENNGDTDNETDTAHIVKTDKTSTIDESIPDHEQRAENSESSLINRSKEVRKRLSFLAEEDTLAKTVHNVGQSETSIALGHSSDHVHVDVTALVSGNENSDDSVPNSQCTEKSNNDVSPERSYALDVRNLAKKSTHDDIIPETDLDDDEEDVCNTTFTQHLNQKLESDSQGSSLERGGRRPSKNAIITITTKYKPPSPERIRKSMTMYGIPKCRWQKPFFSNKLDLAKQRESFNTNASYFDAPAFKSSLEEVTSLTLWRRMKVNEFHPSGASVKSYHIKRTLAGYSSLTIKPLMEPPSSKDVKNWIRAKKYISDKNADVKSRQQNKGETCKNVQDVQRPSINAIDEEIKPQPGTSRNLIHNDSNMDGRMHSPMPRQSALSGTSDESGKSDRTRNSDNSQISENSLDSSLKKALENPLLHKENKTQLGVSYGQIECSSKGSYGNVSNENLQKARAVTVHQYLTSLSLEVHVVTREDLLPDPQCDSIAALFYAIYNDAPTDASEQMEHGAIIVNPNSISARLNKIHSASAMCPILYVATERDAFDSLVKLIERHNPDVLLGWEVEALSWGYVFQRASHLRLNNFPVRISKVPHMQIFGKSDSAHVFEKDDVGEVKVAGRNILDVWRIMRHEAALLTYTFENVMHHVLHERIPCPSFKTLSTWWKQESMIIKSRVIRHYVIRVVGTLKLLNHLDIIGRTCELARLFGIQFYEVFSRGSQFRVESMMLRLAKPMNYIPISPSVQQRAKMRAPECLPLIMEPESKFYTDPLIVLDFQSLYPSMIIAYNYCFSTCLGRIEHIGQYGPFQFGAATLRMKKNTALKLQDKMNFSPCGVAFVKKEVRQGILPRMLTEILNTRLMVKESMKLHPAENRTLQRVLHSQQLGLKLIANVTYGYTSANFSGRMPCIEIGDSVVSKGRETLERAIKLVETTPKWGARVVYGDTDSLFVLLPGKSREEAFTIGEEIADAVTAINPPPVKLKFEKVLHPCILQTKKRYCGFMYETRDQEKPEFLAKGIETVRRDGCPAVSKILERALKILFETKDISLVKQYVNRQFDKIFQRRVSILDLTFAKEFRGIRGYKANACVPALELTRRLIRKDPRAVPRTSERVRYVIVAGAPNQALIHCVRTPMEVVADPSLIPNSVYYITKVIIPPLNRCFNLFGIDVNVCSTACITCGEQTNKEICPDCLLQPSRTVLILLEKVKQLERNYQQIAAICHSCIGQLGGIECVSLDCPVLYRLAQARKELGQVSYMNSIIYGNNSSGIKELNSIAEWHTMSAKDSPSTSKVCSFCNSKEDNEVEYGKIYEHDGIVTHYYCLLLSSNMEQKGNDDEGILGFLAEDIQKELRRGKKLVHINRSSIIPVLYVAPCSYCKKIGATLGCCNVKCKRIFHFPCGLKAGSLHQFFGEFRSYCVNHRPKQKIDDQILKQIRSVDSVLCYICYDKINTNDFVKTLWAPCCRKDAWFHRNCVQQLALSAGYFFKCPLCNNKKDFQKAMQEYGIFVPSQDASWELVPNAFEELLYRHDQCDAPKCLCPKGRKHISNNAKWELTLCRTCGSQGIHMACGQLIWANPAWECEECTSILSDSSQNKEPDPDVQLDSSSDSDSFLDSDLNSDAETDISVGTELPTRLLSNSSPSTSLLDSVADTSVRPGPRSFKLQQEMIKLSKCLELTNTERNVTTEVSPKNINESSNNDDDKKELSTVLPQESKVIGSQEKRQSSSKNEEKSQPTRKEADVITLDESDDDEVQLVTVKRRINVPTLQSGSSRDSCASTSKKTESLLKSLLNTKKKSATSKSQNVMTFDLANNDNINVPKPIESEPEASSKNISTISDQLGVAAARKSTLDLVASNGNNLEETNVAGTDDTDETSVMNIKITNVTSLPPEVFESVPDVCDNVTFKNSTSSMSADTVYTQLLTRDDLTVSTKRSLHEASDAIDNHKKIKRNSFDESIIFTNKLNNIMNPNHTINSTNKQQNDSTSLRKSSEIGKNDSLLKCTSITTNGIAIPMLNEPTNSITIPLSNNRNLSAQSMPLHNDDVHHVQCSISGNNVSVNAQQSKENSVAHRSTEYLAIGKNNPVYLQMPIYLQQIPNPFTISQSAVTPEKTNVYTAIPSSSIILPRVTDNITVLSNQPMLSNPTVVLNQPIMASVTAPILTNAQLAVNQQEAASKGNIFVTTSSAGNDSSNKSYCDGDAGTRPAEVDSAGQKRDDPSSDFHRSVAVRHDIDTHSVFPQVTNNHNTCHQPRLIPRYMNLQDLKFQVGESNNIQMILYDTFSVNVPMKKPRESKNRSATSRKSRESSILASRRASCSSDHIDNIPAEGQRSDKLFRSSKNGSCSINDKSTCARYVAHGQDDTKENLDPIRSRMLSRSDTFDDVNSMNNVDDAVTMSDRFCGENNNETRRVSSDTNLSVVNETIYNTNVDSVTDGVTIVPNNCNQGLRVSLEGVQQHKASNHSRNAISASAEDRPGARLFCKESNRLIHSVDFDLNVVNMNKNVEKVSQDDITVPTSRHVNGDRIGNNHTDDSPTLWNGYKPLDSTNVMRPKVNNQNIARVSNITRFNEHSILNKQIDACDSRKFIRCVGFQENAVRRNGETRAKNNDFCLKVSVDLSKIQNLIDSKPELFENRKHNANDQRCKRTSRLPGLDDCARQQVRYCDIESNDNIGNCLPRGRELQKSNYTCNVERMQQDVFPGANTFLRYQKSNQGIRDFDKDVLDR
ncbi:DNA polymerase zeta catalytic subunit [Temnothorax longispinosus]|uniref:DNA polymerase zeta catalytic subunit n=1 Tax=Temnothorax longispinosus TaxID=300112 RepID=A0A4S2JND8_9HYME|nr:DNA polymerase zeta catalytic subunit [Temnothorax longispinosus]